MSSYDVARVRSHFPQLNDGPDTGAAHFDGPGGSQTPDVVARAMYDVLTGPLANQGDTTPAERNAVTAVGGARAAMADLLGADPAGVVFGRSMTQLTMDLARTIAKDFTFVGKPKPTSDAEPDLAKAGAPGAAGAATTTTTAAE